MTKQEFLNNFAQKEKPKDTTSAMPFLMESIKEAKRNGIEFTKEEVYSMCTELSSRRRWLTAVLSQHRTYRSVYGAFNS